MLPSPRLRRPTLLIVGCGDIGLRVLRLLAGRWRVLALTSTPERLLLLRGAGAVPLLGDLDDVATLARLAGLADAVLHLAPPAADGATDRRTAHLLAALARSARLQCLIYVSTSGVYGDAAGARFNETRSVAPATPRAQRRVDAERRVRRHGRLHAARVCILRVPGIYGLDRPSGDPRERLRRGTPLLTAEDDVYTNHVHADDLAQACVAAMLRGKPQRVYHASDDAQTTMGGHFDAVADAFGLPRAPRLSRSAAAMQLSPMQMSFLSESRRLDNGRLHTELRVRLRYPTPTAAWAEAMANAPVRLPTPA